MFEKRFEYETTVLESPLIMVLSPLPVGNVSINNYSFYAKTWEDLYNVQPNICISRNSLNKIYVSAVLQISTCKDFLQYDGGRDR